MAAPLISAFPQSGNIVLRYKLDEASGNAVDSIGANNLDDTNTVGAGTGYSNVTSGYSYTNSRDFELGNSEYFAASTDFAAAKITGAITIAGWINLESIAGTNHILSKTFSSNFSYSLQVRPTSGVVRFSLSDDGTSETFLDTVATVGTSTWTRIVAVFRPGTEMEIYINGASSVNDTSGIPASIFDGIAKINIGNLDGGTDYFDGLMNEVIIWDVALSDAEVLDDYEVFTTATSSNVLGNPIFFL